MKNLIITADDYGVFPSINQGVKEAIERAKVNSVACLANYAESVKNVKELIAEFGDKIDIGCHLSISSGRPLVVNNNPTFTRGVYFRDFSELDIDGIEKQAQELRKELEAQVQVFLDNGIAVKHLSCHHNTLTTVGGLFKVYLEVAARFGIPMRSVNTQPDKKDARYRFVLELLLMDNVPLKKLKEIRLFRKTIKQVLESYPEIKTPAILETRHYGPIPLIDVWEIGVEKRKREKHEELRNFLLEFIKGDATTAELMVHLISYQDYLSGIDDEIDYPGINTKYFDSRQIELRSILEFDFMSYQEAIRMGSWRDVG
jgi:predicted glycoside hydrolase/deacetylase ChbG (UPF0249 family)